MHASFPLNEVVRFPKTVLPGNVEETNSQSPKPVGRFTMAWHEGLRQGPSYLDRRKLYLLYCKKLNPLARLDGEMQAGARPKDEESKRDGRCTPKCTQSVFPCRWPFLTLVSAGRPVLPLLDSLQFLLSQLNHLLRWLPCDRNACLICVAAGWLSGERSQTARLPAVGGEKPQSQGQKISSCLEVTGQGTGDLME